MTSTEFLKRLAALIIMAGALALVLRLIGGRFMFSMYGPPLAAALTLPFVHRLLANRLAETSRSPRWALLYTIPVAVAALAQIGYWLTFFHGPTNLAVQLGIARHLLHEFDVGHWLTGMLAVCLAVLATRLVDEPGGE